MAGFYNRVELLGVLAGEPERRTSAEGLPVAFFLMSVTQEVMNLRNEPVEETCLVEVEAPGRVGELVQGFFHKDNPVYVEGRLKLDRWIDRDTGRNRSRMYVLAENIQLADAAEMPFNGAEPAPPPAYAGDGQANGGMETPY